MGSGKLIRTSRLTKLEAVLQASVSWNLAQPEMPLDRMCNQWPSAKVATLQGQGQGLRAVRRWVGAIAWYERALAADPADPLPLLAIGQIQRQVGDPEAARPCFEQVVWQAGLQAAAATSEP